MTRFVFAFVALALFAGCGDVKGNIPNRFQVVEDVACGDPRGCAYVRDPKHGLCFLVISAGSTLQMMAEVSCDKLRSPSAAR